MQPNPTGAGCSDDNGSAFVIVNEFVIPNPGSRVCFALNVSHGRLLVLMQSAGLPVDE